MVPAARRCLPPAARSDRFFLSSNRPSLCCSCALHGLVEAQYFFVSAIHIALCFVLPDLSLFCPSFPLRLRVPTHPYLFWPSPPYSHFNYYLGPPSTVPAFYFPSPPFSFPTVCLALCYFFASCIYLGMVAPAVSSGRVGGMLPGFWAGFGQTFSPCFSFFGVFGQSRFGFLLRICTVAFSNHRMQPADPSASCRKLNISHRSLLHPFFRYLRSSCFPFFLIF